MISKGTNLKVWSIFWLLLVPFFVNGQTQFSFERQDLGQEAYYGQTFDIVILHFSVNGNNFQIDNDEGRPMKDLNLNVPNNKILGCRFYDEKENEITYIAEYDDDKNIRISEVKYNKFSDKTTIDVVRLIKYDEYWDLLNNPTGSSIKNNTAPVEVAEEEIYAIADEVVSVLGEWKIKSSHQDFPDKIEIIQNTEDDTKFDLYYIAPGERLIEKQATLQIVNGVYMSTENTPFKVNVVIVPDGTTLIFNNRLYSLSNVNIPVGYEGEYFTASKELYISVVKTPLGKYNIKVATKNEKGVYLIKVSAKEYNILDNKVVLFDEYENRYELLFKDNKIRYGNYTLIK